MGIDLTQLIVLWPINYCQDPRTLNAIQTKPLSQIVWLPGGEKNLDDTLSPFDQNIGVWQMNGRTSCRGIVRAVHTRRAVTRH